MPATIRAATDADLDAIAAFLAGQFHHPAGADRYRRFFSYGWMPDRPNLGFLIEDTGKVVGFIGGIYSRRPIGGVSRVVCNISSWAVAETHRTIGLMLAKRLTDQAGMAFTCFSSSPQVEKLLEFFKFATWPSAKIVAAVPTKLAQLSDALRARIRTPGHGLEESLDPAQRRIFDDHRGYRLGHLVVEIGSRSSYLVLGRRGRGLKTFADVLYASDPDVLARAFGRVTLHAARTLHTPLIGVDGRLFDELPAGAITYRKLRPVQYRGLELTQVDALYSELVPICG